MKSASRSVRGLHVMPSHGRGVDVEYLDPVLKIRLKACREGLPRVIRHSNAQIMRHSPARRKILK